MKRHCKTCRHWDRASAEDAAGRVRSNRVALCEWTRNKREFLESILPWWLPEKLFWGWVGKTNTGPLCGEKCPAWEGRE